MFKFLRLTFLFSTFAILTGCIAQLPWAPDDRIKSAAYSSAGPATITLFTVEANGSKSAGHASLLINGSQQVLYDPAGTWFHRDVPERADMLYGMTPTMVQYYIDYHARQRFHVVKQTKVVSREVADDLIRRAIAKGASMNAMCAQNTSDLLSQTPGFAGFPVSVWPKSGIAAMEAMPGVKTERIFQDDEGKELKT